MLKLVNLSKFYKTNNQIVSALKKVSLEFGINEFVAITGESGSGKTTLLNVISGNDSYEEGEMFFDGVETSAFTPEEWEIYRQRNIGFVFQNYNIIESFSVLDNVMLALSLMNYDAHTRKDRALELIKKVGLGNHVKHRASKLSGGQKQRLVIARALAKDTPIIACDEPTGNLDKTSGERIMKLLSEISKDKLVIVVTHNYAEVEPYASRKIRMADGNVVEDEVLKSVEVKDKIDSNTNVLKLSFKERLGFAIKNVLSTPKKNIFAFIVFTLSALLLGSSYGSYLAVFSATEDYNTSNYYNNLIETRIVAYKDDKSNITDSDIASINNLTNVRTTTKYDLAIDENLSMTNTETNKYMSLFGNVLPVSLIDETDLLAGSMPVSKGQFVIALPDDQVRNISKSEYVDYLGQQFKKDFGMEIVSVYTPTGIISINSLNTTGMDTYFLFSDEDLRTMHEAYYYAHCVQANIFVDGANSFELSLYNIETVSTHSGRVVYISNSRNETITNATVKIKDTYGTKSYDNVTVYLSSSSKGMTKISQDFYNEIMTLSTKQISVFSTSDLNTETLAKTLNDLGYVTSLPSDYVVDGLSNIINFILILFGAIGIIIFAIAIYFISYLVLRFIAQSKTQQYLIIRSIGASKNFIGQNIIIENVFLCLLGTLTATVIMIIVGINVNSIFHTLGIVEYLIFFVALLLMAFYLGLRLRKYLFKNSLAASFKAN